MMKKIELPPREKWNSLCNRPEIPGKDLEETVRDIIKRVKEEGDKALEYFTEKFDGVQPGKLKITPEEISVAAASVPEPLKKAIETAKKNIKNFHSVQLIHEPVIETVEGVKCWRKSVAVEKVGLYIPGGSAPLFSTLLMLGIPAKLAGCEEIIICTPAGKDSRINPVILYTAQLIGISEIYRIGGAQAIAAMAYGTSTVPKVYKIFGPGNQFVTKAKELVQEDGIAIDMPAGPSEVLVIADEMANPEFVAADLLSQAEHGPDSQVILLSDSPALINNVESAIETQLENLPRKNIAAGALENSKLILLPSLVDCMDLSNLYAPEHLIINTSDAKSMADMVKNAGSVFLGEYSCESAGDYASGTNHTLPTNRYARSYSGVSVESFVRKITFQELNSDGIRNIGPAIEVMAAAESLDGHKNAVNIRLKSLKNDRS
jgi:histidinol dehydrogenase